MPRLELSLLGTFRATLDGEDIIAFGYDKVRALLAYLAIESERPHRREILAGLLWPEQPENAARQNLSQALFRLRRAIHDGDGSASFLIVTSQSIQFNPQSDHYLDAKAFLVALQGCGAHHPCSPEDCDRCRTALESAVDRYGGDFLAGLSLPGSPAFEEWSIVQRERLREKALDGLYRLAMCYDALGDVERALAFAVRQVELDPWQERAQREVMALYARCGRRAAALHQYETCRELLAEELGADPAPETQELYQRILDGDIPVSPTGTAERAPRAVGACPYRGLAAFREVDATFFQGRERFSRRLLRAVHERPSLAVIVGPSGSGKSSVAFAGLLPLLRAEQDGAWLIADCRPRAAPFRALADALMRLLAPELSERDRLIEMPRLADRLSQDDVGLCDTVARIFAKHADARRLLLLVDQFEELYTLGIDPPQRDRFLGLLLAAAEATDEGREPSLVLLLTLRADFMGQALSHRPFADALQGAALMLGPMTREELGEAIAKPAEAQGAAFEAGLVERLLDDVGQAPGNLPLLEFSLTLLWSRLDRGWMTHAAYEEIGGVKGALAGYAETVYRELREDKRKAARHVFMQLIQPGEGTEDTRRVAMRSELGDAYWPLVLHLADRRLVVTGRDLTMRSVPTKGNATVEIAHEALIQRWDRLGGWIEEDRAFRTWQERLRVALRGWQVSDQDDGALLRGAPLAEAEGWLAERGEELSTDEKSFVQAGSAQRAHRDAEREQRRRRLVLALAGGILITLVLLLLAAAEWQRAEGEVGSRATAQALAEAAEERALRQASVGLAAQALAELEGASAERGVLLALEALENYPYTPQAEAALARAVNESRPYLVLDEPGGLAVATRAAWSPDGRWLAIGGSSSKAVFTIWDAASGEQIGRADRETVCATHHLVWSPSGDRLLTSTWHPGYLNCDAIQVWDVETGSELLALTGHEGPPGPVDWSPDGSTILTAGEDGTVKLWAAGTAEELHTIPVLTGASRDDRFRLIVRDAAWSPGGDRFVTAAQDGTARVWRLSQRSIAAGDSGTAEEVMALSGHVGGVTGASWSPDGERLATAGQDGTVKIWLTRTGELAVSIVAHEGEVDSVDWSPDGTRLATAGQDSTVKVWLAETGGQVFTFRGVTQPHHVTWSPDSTQLAVRGEYDVRVLDLSRELPQFVGHTDTVVDAQWSPDGQRVATAGQDGSVRMWRTATGEGTPVFGGYPNGAGFVSWSPDGTRFATTGRNGLLRIWDVASGDLQLEVIVSGPEGDYFYYTNWSPDGTRIVASSAPHYHAVVLDAITGETVTTVTGDSCGFPFARWSPDGDRFVTACAFAEGNTPARVWDGTTGELLSVFESQDGVSTRARWSPDGRKLAVTYIGGPVKVYDAMSRETLLVFAGHPKSTFALAWSPDGERVASSDQDGRVKVWDATSGDEVFSFQVPGYTNRVEWSPDGSRLIVVGGFDVPVVRRVWQTTEALIADAKECCVFRELTRAEREQFGLPEK